jgi:hypothetical protein
MHGGQPVCRSSCRGRVATHLLAALTRTTKYVYCDHCKTVVAYEKMVLESEADDRTGLDLACTRCHRVICTFHDTLPADSSPAEPEKTLS